jgi:hypothetical protein
MSETRAQELRRLRKETKKLSREIMIARVLAGLAYFGKMSARSQDKELRDEFDSLFIGVRWMAAQIRNTDAAREASAKARKAKTDKKIGKASTGARSQKEAASIAGMSEAALSQAKKRRKKF